eukprot:6490831-Amphidinium_carterae.3
MPTLGRSFYLLGLRLLAFSKGVDNFLTLAISVPWQLEEFIRQAVNARHPFNASVNTEEVENIFKQTLDSSPREVHNRRMELARWLLKLSAEFAERKSALYGDLPEYVRKVVFEGQEDTAIGTFSQPDWDRGCLYCFGPVCAPCRPQHQGIGGACKEQQQ